MLDRRVIQRIIILAVLIISVIPVIYAIPSTAATHVEINFFQNPQRIIGMVLIFLINITGILSILRILKESE